MNIFKLEKIREATRQCLSGKMLLQAAIGMNLFFMTGCRGAPSINLLGSFFPSWMFCMILGVLGALLLRQFFIKTKIDPYLLWPVFVYFCLWICITLLSWLFFFRN